MKETRSSKFAKTDDKIDESLLIQGFHSLNVKIWLNLNTIRNAVLHRQEDSLSSHCCVHGYDICIRTFDMQINPWRISCISLQKKTKTRRRRKKNKQEEHSHCFLKKQHDLRFIAISGYLVERPNKHLSFDIERLLRHVKTINSPPNNDDHFKSICFTLNG